MEAIFHSFIKAFGWSIVHSFWQGAIIYALLFLVLISIPKLSPVAKHNLSYFSICAIFIWFVATFIQQWHLPVKTTAILFLPVENQLSISATSGWSLSKLEMLFPTITSIYLGGIIIQSFVLYKGYLVLKKLRKNSLEAVPADWEQICYKVIAKLNIKKGIDFHISFLAQVPMVIGYFKPVILFPASLVTSLDTDQVEAILIHELTHIRRNDYLLNLIKTFMDTILFFNPFVWLTGRFIKIEREHVCDDMVLKYTGQPVKYAETLLQIEMIKSQPTPQAAMAVSGKKQYLFDRIKRMTNMKTNYMNLKQQLAGVTIVIAAVFCLAWLVPSNMTKIKAGNKTTDLKAKSSLPVASKGSVFYPIDKDTIITPKKKPEVKIIVTDPDGKRQEYNSLKALPDSLKEGMGMFQGNNFSFIADSLIINGKALSEQLNGVFNNPEFLKAQREVAEQFNSPEFKENMKKSFQSFNSPEFKKQQEELMKKLNSAEFKKQEAELKKQQAQLMAKLHSKEFKDGQKELISRLNSDVFNKLPQLRLEGPDFTFSGVDSLFFSGENKGDYRIFMESPEKSKQEKELENNKQYQKLKKKFDRDVEKLRKKQVEESLK